MAQTLGELLMGTNAPTTAAQAGLLAAAPTPLPAGDQIVSSLDTSPFREGSQSLLTSGQLYVLANDLVMKYWTHNVSLDANGNFLPRDDAGPCALILFTEGVGTNAPIYSMWSCPTGAAGSTPGTFTKVWSIDLTQGLIAETPQSTGWGTPTGGAVANNFAGASATLAQTSAALAQLLIVLKAKGTIGA